MSNEVTRFFYLQWQQPEKRYPFLVSLGLSLIIIVFSNVSIFGALGVFMGSAIIAFALSPLVKYAMRFAAKLEETMTEVALTSKEAKETVANVKEKVLPELQGLVKESVDNLNQKVVPQLQELVKETVENVQDIIEDKTDKIIDITQDAVADSTLILKNTTEDLQAVLCDVDQKTLPTLNKTVSEFGKVVSPITGTVDIGKSVWKKTIGRLTGDNTPPMQVIAPDVPNEDNKQEKAQKRQQEREALATQRALEREVRQEKRKEERAKRHEKTASDGSSAIITMPVITAPAKTKSKQRPILLVKAKIVPPVVEESLEKAANTFTPAHDNHTIAQPQMAQPKAKSSKNRLH